MGNVVRLLPPPATLTSFFPRTPFPPHTHTPAKSYVPIAAAPVSVPRLQLHLPQKGNAHASVAEFGVVVDVAVPAAVVPVVVFVVAIVVVRRRSWWHRCRCRRSRLVAISLPSAVVVAVVVVVVVGIVIIRPRRHGYYNGQLWLPLWQ